MFEPISLPPKEYLRLPVDANIEFIDTDNKVKILESLIGQTYIGVDAEWRTQAHRWHKTEGISLF